MVQRVDPSVGQADNGDPHHQILSEVFAEGSVTLPVYLNLGINVICIHAISPDAEFESTNPVHFETDDGPVYTLGSILVYTANDIDPRLFYVVSHVPENLYPGNPAGIIGNLSTYDP